MIRRAVLSDVKKIHGLLSEYGKRGELLPRPLSVLYENLRNFFVYDDPKNGIIGCCSLQFSWEDLAEIRSLAVHPDHVGNGIGTMLTEASINDAVTFGVRNVFTLTYRPGFFKRFDFAVIDRSDLPIKIWADCILCVKYPDCDETAMMKVLRK